MSSLDTIYKKMAASLNHNPAEDVHVTHHTQSMARHVSPNVAHELNNILTVIQGYADRMLIKHSEDYPALQPNFKLIADAARRAADVVREATPPLNPTYIRQVSPKARVQPESVAA